jgi:hypothetical protein
MTPERFQQIERLASLVLQKEKSEQAEFLDKACLGDPELRREVESLLASDEKAGDFLGEPAAPLVANRPMGDSSQGGSVVGAHELTARRPILEPVSTGEVGPLAEQDPECGLLLCRGCAPAFQAVLAFGDRIVASRFATPRCNHRQRHQCSDSKKAAATRFDRLAHTLPAFFLLINGLGGTAYGRPRAPAGHEMCWTNQSAEPPTTALKLPER